MEWEDSGSEAEEREIEKQVKGLLRRQVETDQGMKSPKILGK